MNGIQRRSPVMFNALEKEVLDRDGWRVVKKYAGEGAAPYLVDLSHLPRWDLQDRDLTVYPPTGVTIPASIGECRIQETLVVNRMNRTQANIWHLAPNSDVMPEEQSFTDIRENTACLAVLGSGSIALSEKVSRLDLADPVHRTPCLLQGPFARVPCQLVLLRNQNGREGFVFTFSRGYAGDVVDLLLFAGREHGLRPAGEDRMSDFINLRS